MERSEMNKKIDEMNIRLDKILEDSGSERKKMETYISKFKIEREIKEHHKIISDEKLSKEFEDFKRILLDREDFTPTPIEIIDNNLTDEEVEDYKVMICSQKYIEGIKLKDGTIIYPDNSPDFYKELALDRIEWMRYEETDFKEYNQIRTYQRMEILYNRAWGDIAKMFLKEVEI